jgi:hypothetical protein
VKVFIANVKLSISTTGTVSQNSSYAYPIDIAYGNLIRPELKCNTPCYTCLNTNPNYCTACWGKGTKGDFKLTFLQTSNGQSTCKAACDDGYSVNGHTVEVKNIKTGKLDPAKTYY